MDLCSTERNGSTYHKRDEEYLSVTMVEYFIPSIIAMILHRMILILVARLTVPMKAIPTLSRMKRFMFHPIVNLTM